MSFHTFNKRNRGNKSFQILKFSNSSSRLHGSLGRPWEIHEPPEFFMCIRFFWGDSPYLITDSKRPVPSTSSKPLFYVYQPVCMYLVLFRSQAILGIMPGMKGKSHCRSKGVYVLLLAVFLCIDVGFFLFVISLSS